MDPCFWRETEADRVTRVVVFPRRAERCLHWSFSGNPPEMAPMEGSGPGSGGDRDPGPYFLMFVWVRGHSFTFLRIPDLRTSP